MDSKQEEVRKLNKALKNNASREILNFGIFDTEVNVDRGVVEYASKMGPLDKFPFMDLTGRPAITASSPTGFISKENGIPELTGVYNLRYGGFLDKSYNETMEQWREFRHKDSHPFNLLCVRWGDDDGYRNGQLIRCPHIGLYKKPDRDCVVVVASGKHLERYGNKIAGKGRIMLLGNFDAERAENNVFDVDGNFLKKYKVRI